MAATMASKCSTSFNALRVDSQRPPSARTAPSPACGRGRLQVVAKGWGLSDWFGGENYMASKIGNKIDLNTRDQPKGDGTIVQVSFVGAGGISMTIDMPDDTYILDAAIEAGLELPFSCRGGVCGACVAKVSKGAVDQSDIDDLEFTVTEEQQEEGLALLCMARPIGDCEIETQSDYGYSLGVKGWEGATGYINGKDPVSLGVEQDATYNPKL